jgi:transcriptional regulator with AAA-type ATPase domain
MRFPEKEPFAMPKLIVPAPTLSPARPPQPAWRLRVQDPTGETRLLKLGGRACLGKGPGAHVRLRDPLCAASAAILECREDGGEGAPYWLEVPPGSPDARLGDLRVRAACLPPGLPLVLGETTLILERGAPAEGESGGAGGGDGWQALADAHTPAGARPWLTCSPEGRETRRLALRAAATPLSVYLAGETGVGKEVLAHLIHAWSARARGPFVPLHCAALPLSIVESELFGHVKGAFTGATQQRPGALMQAHGGTLFLDEVGDLPMDIQVKLLRFLESGEIRPVGSDRLTHADVRLVCATHRPLTRLVDEGKFRQDLYYRLASVTIEIPPLRARPEDIDLLASRFGADLKRAISPEAMQRLQAYDWPGNVRELRHAIERAAALGDAFAPMIDAHAFDFLLTRDSLLRTPALELGLPLLKLDEMERALILKALRLAQGNRGAAAESLGVARSTLFEMLKRHGIPGPRAAESDG